MPFITSFVPQSERFMQAFILSNPPTDNRFVVWTDSGLSIEHLARCNLNNTYCYLSPVKLSPQDLPVKDFALLLATEILKLTTGLGSASSIGKAIVSSASPISLLSVVNNFLSFPITQPLLNIVQSKGYTLELGVGDNRVGAGAESRFQIVNNFNGQNCSNLLLTNEPFPTTRYDFRLTFDQSSLTLTDTHGGAPNTYGSIRYLKVGVKP